MNLVDQFGRKIPSGEQRKIAEDKLREFMERHKSKFEGHLRQYGPIGFPVKYDLERQKWFWVDSPEPEGQVTP
jgi:hypothetical protein